LFAKSHGKEKNDGRKTSKHAVVGKTKNTGKRKYTKGKNKNTELRKKKRQKSADPNQQQFQSSNFCGECCGFYYDSDQNEDEEWICCQKCQRWFHETCADAVNDPNIRVIVATSRYGFKYL